MCITKDIISSLKKVQENTEIFIPNNNGTLSFSQIHCIAIIGYIKDANVTKISKELVMTTGAIQKCVRNYSTKVLLSGIRMQKTTKKYTID